MFNIPDEKLRKIFLELDDVFLFNGIDKEDERFVIVSMYNSVHQAYLTIKQYDMLEQSIRDDDERKKMVKK